MKIIRQINNNAALALDGNGKELVVLGRGVGFPKMPYELTDLSRIERTFYDVSPKYFGMAADLPRPLVLACAEIAERAEIELDCALNPNLPFTLADHLNFAAERLRKGIEISTPLAYDVRHLYPKETDLVQRLASGRQVEERISGMLAQMRRDYPQAYQCARAIADYFRAAWNWQCNDEEIVYLMLHITRLQEKNEA